MHRHTLNIDQDLLRRAREIHPHATTTALVDAGLRALIAQDAAERLADMAGIAPEYVPARRGVGDKAHGA